MIARLLRRLGWCDHAHTYRERRDASYGGVAVPHYVCADCGRAWPVITRTPEEHAEATQAGRIRLPQAQRAPQTGAVVEIGRRRSRGGR